ncbi:hypothetical protein CPC735_030120 [Coccidioides posadasii C735 delta SOWgp]|uniref:Uncharacterized protein n=1 Tax=Coccidioides posadasii (strain C735) TaxID=222929 RepID=C5P4N6_COCP7|nr:hypothetical protein CPC735_030120 [Coccidioides posadasii C735 delta SOWgp]EER27676.1 hypothetical protein CPC735_030120 [Coccidioides posadasii C735 delta SOWgp]|eukprot:XP_003069821.1 hypothetical protein CPC735_030120 [Coccidioides posadasii C735 delta SOWgp]
MLCMSVSGLTYPDLVLVSTASRSVFYQRLLSRLFDQYSSDIARLLPGAYTRLLL